MSPLRRLSVATLLALAAACTSSPTTPTPTPQPTPTPPAATTGVVSGTVSHVTTGVRVSAAQVTVGGKAGTTNGYGAYSIADVPLGSATLRVTADGFHAHERTITVETTTTIAVALTPVDAPPPPPSVPTATVHGTVTSATTTLPIEDADVDLVVTIEQRFKTRTDALGKWQVSNVPIGVRAELRIDATGHTPIAQPLDIETASVTTTVSLTPVTAPPPPPPPSAFSTLVRFVDAFSRGGIGGAVLTAQGLIAAASGGDGRTTVSAEASESAPRRVSISAPGFVTRETFLRVPGNEAEIDLIPSSDLGDFNALARPDGSIAQWAQAPRLVIEEWVLFGTSAVLNGTVLTTSVVESTAAELSALEADLRDALPKVTGGAIQSFESVRRQRSTFGSQVDMMVDGQITVARVSGLAFFVGYNGYAKWTTSGGRITAAMIMVDVNLDGASNAVHVRGHELGHAMGFQHVGRHSIMRPEAPTTFTEWDLAAMRLAYQRPIGNRSPDVDPDGFATNALHRLAHSALCHRR